MRDGGGWGRAHGLQPLGGAYRPEPDTADPGLRLIGEPRFALEVPLELDIA